MHYTKQPTQGFNSFKNEITVQLNNGWGGSDEVLF